MGFFDFITAPIDAIGDLFSASGGSGNFVGDVATGGAISNNRAIEQTNAQNIAFAREVTGFQERMSNSAYQRATADMRAAGLNPMLAYSQGGASVPSGAQPTLTAPRPGDVAAGLAETAKKVATLSAGLAQTNSQTTVNHAQAKLNVANTGLAEENRIKTQNQAKESVVNAEKTEEDTKLIQQLQQKAKYETIAAREAATKSAMDTELRKERFETDRKLQDLDSVLERINQAASSIGTGMGAMLRSTRTGKMLNPPPNSSPQKPKGGFDWETGRLRRSGRKGIPLP